MRRIAFLALLFLSLNTFAANPQVDVVQVDTGLHSDSNGIVNFKKSAVTNPKPEFPKKETTPDPVFQRKIDGIYQDLVNTFNEDYRWYTHGTEMALSLMSAAERLRMDPINLIQLGYTKNHVGQLILSLNQAVRLHPKVISLSLAGNIIIPDERQAIQNANDHGILVLAASGNEYKRNKSYPASYGLPCLVSVSTVSYGRVPDYANEGEIYVNVFGYENGTSYSTARAGAYVIQYYRVHPKATCQQAKAWLIRQFPRPK